MKDQNILNKLLSHISQASQWNQLKTRKDCKDFKRKTMGCSYVLKDVAVLSMNSHSKNMPKYVRKYSKKKLKRNNSLLGQVKVKIKIEKDRNCWRKWKNYINAQIVQDHLDMKYSRNTWKFAWKCLQRKTERILCRGRHPLERRCKHNCNQLSNYLSKHR